MGLTNPTLLERKAIRDLQRENPETSLMPTDLAGEWLIQREADGLSIRENPETSLISTDLAGEACIQRERLISNDGLIGEKLPNSSHTGDEWLIQREGFR